MKIYMVGGAVRDEILGRVPHDRDYVVVGATEQEMLDLGYTKVGASFPVFLHPETKEEYALARTEKKNGSGHKGFTVEFDRWVTLEQDLLRRDLTINAIAKDMETGRYIDPCGGICDIDAKKICMVGANFYEDPLRVLRAIRFLTQLGEEWSFDEFTLNTLKSMCSDPETRKELCDLPFERVWKELEKVFMTTKPSLFFRTLKEINAPFFEEVQALAGIPQPSEWHYGDAFEHTMMALDNVVLFSEPSKENIKIRFAVLLHDVGKAVTFNKNGNLHSHESYGSVLIREKYENVNLPKECFILALKVASYHGKFGYVSQMGAKAIKNLIVDCGNYFKDTAVCSMIDQSAHKNKSCAIANIMKMIKLQKDFKSYNRTPIALASRERTGERFIAEDIHKADLSFLKRYLKEVDWKK